MAETFVKIFRQPLYILITIVVFVVVTFLAITAPNFSLISQISESFGFVAAIKTAFSLIGSIQTNFTVFSAVNTLLIALFFGINVSLFVYYYKKFKQLKEFGGAKTSVIGLLVGALGIGCASCGSLVLIGLLSAFGLSGLFDLLPFGGEEFSILGLILLIFSTYYLLKKIHQPITCKI